MISSKRFFLFALLISSFLQAEDPFLLDPTIQKQLGEIGEKFKKGLDEDDIHSIVFDGRTGVGKTAIADNFVQSLVEETGCSVIDAWKEWRTFARTLSPQEYVVEIFKRARQAGKGAIVRLEDFEWLSDNRKIPVDAPTVVEICRDNGKEVHTNAQTVSALRAELSRQLKGCKKHQVLVIATCLKFSSLDERVQGAIDKRVHVPRPDYKTRLGLFKLKTTQSSLVFFLDKVFPFLFGKIPPRPFLSIAHAMRTEPYG